MSEWRDWTQRPSGQDHGLCRKQINAAVDVAVQNAADRDAAVARAEAAEQALQRVRELAADVDTWTPYDSRDTGETFLAESVRDLLDDIRRALDETP